MGLKVVQWATGGVGIAAISGVLEHPELELVGCWVHSEAKNGKDVGEIMDQLGFMMLKSPKFIDKTGYFPQQNIDTVFLQLNEGLQLIRGKLGEDLYLKLMNMSDQMRAHFEADLGDARIEAPQLHAQCLDERDVQRELQRRAFRHDLRRRARR